MKDRFDYLLAQFNDPDEGLSVSDTHELCTMLVHEREQLSAEIKILRKQSQEAVKDE